MGIKTKDALASIRNFTHGIQRSAWHCRWLCSHKFNPFGSRLGQLRVFNVKCLGTWMGQELQAGSYSKCCGTCFLSGSTLGSVRCFLFGPQGQIFLSLHLLSSTRHANLRIAKMTKQSMW